MKKITLFISLLFYSITFSQTFTVDDIQYTVNTATTVTAVDYLGTGGAVTIPSTVLDNGINYNVTNIGDSAFFNNNLTSVIIPNSITSIGENAFRDNFLTSILLPNSINIIERFVFFNNQLTSVTIPNSVTSMLNGAFQKNQLTNVLISDSVISIGTAVFADNQLTSITIPNSVTSIGVLAFSDNQLTSITIPNSVTSIGLFAFRNNQLTSITIPNSITSIGVSTFQNNQLTNFTIPNSITSIERFAFRNNQLTSITIPNSVTFIGLFAFGFDTTLNSSTVISKITTNIPSYSRFFVDLSNTDIRPLIDLTIPLGTTQAYIDAGWTDFKSITEDGEILSNPEFSVNDEITYFFNINKIVVTPKNGVNLNSISIYDLTGKLINTYTDNEIATNYLKSGLYLIQITTNKGVVVKKYMK